MQGMGTSTPMKTWTPTPGAETTPTMLLPGLSGTKVRVAFKPSAIMYEMMHVTNGDSSFKISSRCHFL